MKSKSKWLCSFSRSSNESTRYAHRNFIKEWIRNAVGTQFNDHDDAVHQKILILH
uniref:Uncharacterized protein n=1 Tax=Arundo donax TaxID=35708 RepID=A0A0A9EP84_ARUDO